jgi:hypothetical protein
VAAASPEDRFRAAVAERPLERPTLLPTAVLPLARAVTGRSQAPRYTTGPATRHALRAAGALGATSGSVIHLPEPPSMAPRALEVLAHELAHVAERTPRPRFLLGSPGGAHDQGERQARRVGEAARAGAANLVGAMAAGLPATVAGGSRVADLPVGGGAGVAGAARQATLNAAGLTGGAASIVAEAADPAGPPVPAMTAAGASSAAPGEVGVGSWTGTPAGPATATAAAGPAAAGAAPGGGALGHSQVSELVEALEERLLAEIERRGGRYAGVF